MTRGDGDQLVEVEQAGSGRLLHRLLLAEVPQPGRWLELEGTSYLVLQRRHRYRLVQGRYRLARVVLQVKAQRRPAEARWWRDRWVIGDPSCAYNALSPLLRCAVLPDGPCSGCGHHRLR
ncbi:MAG: DUF6464 family protein [Prochlorococcaceae cyanobacterium]|jgi:hypothetical protein